MVGDSMQTYCPLYRAIFTRFLLRFRYCPLYRAIFTQKSQPVQNLVSCRTSVRYCPLYRAIFTSAAKDWLEKIHLYNVIAHYIGLFSHQQLHSLHQQTHGLRFTLLPTISGYFHNMFGRVFGRYGAMRGRYGYCPLYRAIFTNKTLPKFGVRQADGLLPTISGYFHKN